MQDFYIYKTIFLLFMFVLGSAIGSFLCCQARRLRLKHEGTALSAQPNSTNPSKPKTSSSQSLGSRSVCLHCHHRLKWYDNLPIVSWLILRGECRYCHKKIGLAELLSELGLASAFLVTSIHFDLEAITPFSASIFLMTLLLIISLGFLAIYDGLYGELPSLCLTFSIICAIIIAVLRQWEIFSITSFSSEILKNNLLHILLSVVVLAGTYLILYLFSRGKWVGDGDWLLALALAIVLANSWLALITLFLTNFLASLIMIPALKLNQRKPKSAKIHLGPFLIIAFIIVFSFSDFFLNMI